MLLQERKSLMTLVAFKDQGLEDVSGYVLNVGHRVCTPIIMAFERSYKQRMFITAFSSLLDFQRVHLFQFLNELLIFNYFIFHVSFFTFIEDLDVFVVFAKITNIIYTIMGVSWNTPVFLWKWRIKILGAMLQAFEHEFVMTNMSKDYKTIVETAGCMASLCPSTRMVPTTRPTARIWLMYNFILFVEGQ